MLQGKTTSSGRGACVTRIVQVVQPGYSIGERVLRPAMVGVSKGGPKQAPVEPGPVNEQAEKDARKALDALRLRTEEARGPDELLDLLRVRARECRGVGEAGEELGGDLVDAHVGALRGQDGRDEQLERRREVELAASVGIGLGEAAVDRSRASHEREPRGRGGGGPALTRHTAG